MVIMCYFLTARLNDTITICGQFYPFRIYLTMSAQISSQITEYKSSMEDVSECFVWRQKGNSKEFIYCLAYSDSNLKLFTLFIAWKQKIY